MLPVYTLQELGNFSNKTITRGEGVEGVEWPIIPRSHPVVQYPCHRLQHHHVCACVYYIHMCQYECVHAVCPAPPLITFTDRACPYLQKCFSESGVSMEEISPHWECPCSGGDTRHVITFKLGNAYTMVRSATTTTKAGLSVKNPNSHIHIIIMIIHTIIKAGAICMYNNS